MKTYLFFLLFLSFISIVSADIFDDVSVSGEISAEDRKDLTDAVSHIENAVNKDGVDSILRQLSSQARAGLREEIESLGGKSIRLRQSITSMEVLENGQVKVKGPYSAAGPGWDINGISNYYVFEKSGAGDNTWLLVDTNFPAKLGMRYVFKIVGIVFLIIVLVSLPLTAFWVWMLIDAVKREFDNKVAWIVILALTSFIGALIYYFTIRRRAKQTEKNIKMKRKVLP